MWSSNCSSKRSKSQSARQLVVPENFIDEFRRKGLGPVPNANTRGRGSSCWNTQNSHVPGAAQEELQAIRVDLEYDFEREYHQESPLQFVVLHSNGHSVRDNQQVDEVTEESAKRLVHQRQGLTTCSSHGLTRGSPPPSHFFPPKAHRCFEMLDFTGATFSARPIHRLRS